MEESMIISEITRIQADLKKYIDWNDTQNPGYYSLVDQLFGEFRDYPVYVTNYCDII